LPAGRPSAPLFQPVWPRLIAFGKLKSLDQVPLRASRAPRIPSGSRFAAPIHSGN